MPLMLLNGFNGLIFFMTLLIVAGCSPDTEKPEQASRSVRSVVPTRDTGYYGWDTAVLRNIYTEFHILPESGGRYIGYGALGTRMLWHDSSREGESGDFNPGGAWVIPAGTDIGEWPVSTISPYETMKYQADLTESGFTMTSSDTGEYRIVVEGGLEPMSTTVRQRYTLERTAEGNARSGLRQVISIPVESDVMIYAPVADGGWNVIAGGENNPQWIGVENGVFRARYDRRYGRIGLTLTEGWLAWRNAGNGMTFVVRFPVAVGTYPGGYHVEIRTLGEGETPTGGHLTYTPETARMEVVVMSRIENLGIGGKLSMDIRWETSRVSDIVKILPNGILSQEFRMRNGKFTGKFGVFKGGHLRYSYLDNRKESLGYRNMYQINPLNEVVVDHGFEFFTFPENVKHLEFRAVDNKFDDLEVFGDIAIER